MPNTEKPVEETKSTFKPNRKQRIKLFRLKQALGYLPKKPEGKIVGKHEYIRLEDAIEPYFKEIQHTMVPHEGDEHGTCAVCEKILSTEDITINPVCTYGQDPSQLDTKLTELKSADRKVLGITKEWGGYTIKMMAQRQ